MDELINQRIKRIIDNSGKSINAYANEIGVSQPTLKACVDGSNNPSFETIQKIIIGNPIISTEWLLRGIGDITINSSPVEVEIEDSPIKKNSKLLENIIEIRNKRNYTQEQVSSYLNMSQSGYALIERGERGLQFELLERIALLYDMDVVDVIKYPDIYVKNNNRSTRVLVELDVEDDELIKMGFKDKVIQVLNK